MYTYDAQGKKMAIMRTAVAKITLRFRVIWSEYSPFVDISLRKHDHSNTCKLKILPPKKNEIFQIKILIFIIFLLKT